MKRNFYLQHPLMAMSDPRMENLLDKEGPRGIGAYWIIIEKLSLLPDARAKLKYLHPYKSKKLSIVYLKKIIREYQLFKLEEDGFFSPEELNPVKKKEKKTAKSNRENVDSYAENDEKRKKVSENKPEKQAKNQDNQLKDSTISKTCTEMIKENIKDIITAAAKEKETTATADNSLTVCDNYGQPQPTLHPIRPWREMVDELSEPTPWLEAVCMQSCYGELLMRHIEDALAFFKQHIEIYDKGNELLTISEVRRYFANYAKAGKPTSQALHATLIALDAKQQATAPPDPYRYEQLKGGQRTYLGCPIPQDAPPRPNDKAFWDNEKHTWDSQY